LEKNYKEGMSEDECVKLCVRGLLEVVQTGAANIEIAVMLESGVKMLSLKQVEDVVALIEKEKEEEAAAKKKQGTSAATAMDTSK
jgi:20S proteasome subunit alpha 4